MTNMLDQELEEQCRLNSMGAEREYVLLGKIAQLEKTLERELAENCLLRLAIQRALDDSESGSGWGPDVTVCGYLLDALTINNGIHSEAKP